MEAVCAKEKKAWRINESETTIFFMFYFLHKATTQPPLFPGKTAGIWMKRSKFWVELKSKKQVAN
jgi:hypothetical protein